MDKSTVINGIEDIQYFDEIACICGLSFPESATDFQKASLCLAHLMAALRESVLKGCVISSNLIGIVNKLALILVVNGDKQK